MLVEENLFSDNNAPEFDQILKIMLPYYKIAMNAKKEDAQKALSNLPKELKAYHPWLKQISTADIFKE